MPERRLQLHVEASELAARRQAWRTPEPRFARGYGALFAAHILPAEQGCDFDVLARPGVIAEPEIF